MQHIWVTYIDAQKRIVHHEIMLVPKWVTEIDNQEIVDELLRLGSLDAVEAAHRAGLISDSTANELRTKFQPHTSWLQNLFESAVDTLLQR